MKPTAADAGCCRLPKSGCPWWKVRQRCLTGLIFAAALAVLAPAGADAKPAYEVHPGGLQLILPVEKRSDSIISVSINGRQRVKYAVEGPSSAIEYSTRGRVNSRRIVADFGALGRIDVRLHLVPQPPDPPHRGRCKGRAPLYQHGVYRGIIDFPRMPGVPEISTRSGHVYFERRFRQVCRRRPPRPKPALYPKLTRKVEEGVLIVNGKGEGRTVRLWATIFALRQSPAYSGGTCGATAYERREGVRITRRTGRFFYHNSFVMSRRGKRPETVEVEPPKPFAGHAIYSHSPGSPPSWTDDLRVDLPGADGVPLTGPGFSAVLCRGRVGSCLWKRLQPES